MIHVPPRERTDGRAIVTVTGAETGGAMAVIEQQLAARAFIPPHTHANDVWVHVRTGIVGVLVGDEIATGGRGSWLLKPREVEHAMWNPGDEPADITEILTPAGAEGFFLGMRELASDDEAGFRALAAQHGLRFNPDSPWTEEIRRRFDLA